MTARGAVTSAARPQNRAHPWRRRALLGAGVGLACALLAHSAHAIVISEHGREYGVTPIRGVAATSIPGARRVLGTRPSLRPFDAGGALAYHGGPVMHHVTTHVVYWDPGGEFTTTTKEIFAGFFNAVAADSGKATNVFAVAGQYTDTTSNAAYSSTFGGAAVDPTPYPASDCTTPLKGDKGPYIRCFSDTLLQTELKTFVAAQKLPTGPEQQYFLLTPHKVVTCLQPEQGICSNNFYCAYHSVIKPGIGGEIIYSDIPFSLLDTVEHTKGCQDDGTPAVQTPNGDTNIANPTRYADVALKYTSHEYVEASTDPLPGSGWIDSHEQEIGDKCNGIHPTEEEGIGYDASAFLPTLGGDAKAGTLFTQLINGGHYYLQSEWDNAAAACLMQPAPISGAGLTATPAGTTPGTPISFLATAKDPYKAVTYSWTFGDGSGASGQAPSHVYATTGTFPVTMTVRDTLTNASTSVTQTVAINDVPTAAFTASPILASAGVPMSFDASQSRDPDGSIANYSWSFGDGVSASSGPTASHTFTTPGVYFVKLTVTDSGQQSAVVEHVVTVVPAVATVAQVKSPIQGLAASFNSRTGAITLTGAINGAGAVSWLASFRNGTFGAFAAAGHRCRAGQVRLQGACRPARVVFAKGSIATLGGRFKLVLTPSRSALRALKAAFRRKRPLPVTVTLAFRGAQVGSSGSQTRVLAVRLKRG